MKSAVWLPGARRDCQAFVVGRTKVVVLVQPVCSHTHIQALPGRRPHMRCDGALEWSLKWTWRSNVVNVVRSSVRTTLLKSSNAMRPSPRSHALNLAKRVRQCATAVNRSRPRCEIRYQQLICQASLHSHAPWLHQTASVVQNSGWQL